MNGKKNYDNYSYNVKQWDFIYFNFNLFKRIKMIHNSPFDFSHLPDELREKLVSKLSDELEPKYCKSCGSKLGINCGKAEPDYNEDYCSLGCYKK